jgi:hypothetical protein
MAICAGPTCTLNAIRESPSTATERELLAHPVPRISIGQPAISLKQHRRGHHRETSGSMTTSCVAGGCPYSRYRVLQRSPELRRRTAGRISVHRRQFRPGRRREFVAEGGWIVRQRRRLRRQDLEWSCQVGGAEESRARKGGDVRPRRLRARRSLSRLASCGEDWRWVRGSVCFSHRLATQAQFVQSEMRFRCPNSISTFSRIMRGRLLEQLPRTALSRPRPVTLWLV